MRRNPGAVADALFSTFVKRDDMSDSDFDTAFLACLAIADHFDETRKTREALTTAGK